MDVPRRLVQPALLAAAFFISTTGLVYQLVGGTLASYVLGDSVAQFSFVIGLYLFAMGVGSYLSKFVENDLLVRFVEIELALALAGGLSAPLLFKVYTSFGLFRFALYGFVFIIGALVGLEIPLLIRLLKFSLDLKDLVARVLSVDYLGALVASVLFPSLLLPRLGIHQTSLVFGFLNVGVGLMGTWLFPLERRTLVRLRLLAGVVTAALVLCLALLGKMVKASEATFFGSPIIHVSQSPYQRVVVTESPRTLRLFLNGNLQFSADDEYRYHEALVHPALASMPWARRVLVLGGGDGLAVREILRYANIEHVTLVDLDPAMTDLFTRNAYLAGLNGGALSDPRVTVINADAGQWLDENAEVFDLIVADFPDPSNFGLGKLYSVPIYRLMAKHLSANGALVVQSTSPWFAPRSFWCIDATLREAGFVTQPYHAYVPSFGEWGFNLATRRPGFVPPESYPVPTRFLDADTTRAMFRFPPDMRPPAVEPNHLNSQTLVHYFEQDWRNVVR